MIPHTELKMSPKNWAFSTVWMLIPNIENSSWNRVQQYSNNMYNEITVFENYSQKVSFYNLAKP